MTSKINLHTGWNLETPWPHLSLPYSRSLHCLQGPKYPFSAADPAVKSKVKSRLIIFGKMILDYSKILFFRTLLSNTQFFHDSLTLATLSFATNVCQMFAEFINCNTHF